ncbi:MULTISPECIES: hypothetical protein [unclassified Rhodococcus (in: high G+C Gram-positive bacteria)]|uniref:hypothetical protein n=1 Tax=unclassified Rhodococcus (in: high G+C Gram-positive bacteria) TaxID=192944 RepID=UPI00113FE445|nr:MULTISPECIES: hypothetical protein [unclassified Rhodococcus (in: high G+C Gram-positive bacteria)]
MDDIHVTAHTDRDPYTKAFRRVIRTIQESCTVADLGYYFSLIEYAREKNSSGFLTKKEVRIVAVQVGYSSFRASLVRLSGAGVIARQDDDYQIDWTGQTTAEKRIERRDQNRLNQQKARERGAERQGLHNAGDHSKCQLPYCPLATRWARGKKPKGTDSNPLTSSDDALGSKEGKKFPYREPSSFGYGEDGPAQAPPGQRSDAGAPTLPGPSSDTDPSAPTKSAPKRKRKRAPVDLGNGEVI